MTHVELFAGVGGISIAAEQAGFRTIAQVERDPYCLRVLEKYWPGVRRFTDIRGLSLSRLIGCGEKERLEWLEKRIVERNVWIVAENAGHTWKRWVPAVRSSLWEIGYSSLSVRVQAADVGACHRRDRAFVIAHPDSEFLRQFQRRWLGEGREMAQELAVSRDWAPRRLGAYDGIPNRVDRLRCLGNAVVPQQVYPILQAIAEVENEHTLQSADR